MGWVTSDTRHHYGAATLPGAAFGDPPITLRLRLATGLLYGTTPDQQHAALTATDPTTLPPTAAALTQLRHILTDLTGPAPGAALDCRAEPADLAAPCT